MVFVCCGGGGGGSLPDCAMADGKQPAGKESDDKSAPAAVASGGSAAAAAPINLTALLQAQKEWSRSIVYTGDAKVLANTFGPKDVLESEIAYVPTRCKRSVTDAVTTSDNPATLTLRESDNQLSDSCLIARCIYI